MAGEAMQKGGAMSEEDFELRVHFDKIEQNANAEGYRIRIGNMDIGYLELQGGFSLDELKAIVAGWEARPGE